MKKRLFVFGLILFSSVYCYAYDFYAAAPSGQILFYDTSSSGTTVTVVAPGGVLNRWNSYTKPTGALTIPSVVTYNGHNYTVTKIQQCAFYQCSGLTSVTIPNTVTEIGSVGYSGGYGSFYQCTGLVSVTLPNSITIIKSGTFGGCSALTSITIPANITEIEVGAFSDCTSLTSIFFNAPNCIVQYNSSNNGPFVGCNNVSSITFGNNVVKVPSYLCSRLENLSSISFGNNITEIGEYSFYECTGLSHVDIPSSVTIIKQRAFYGCNNLLTAIIREGVSMIADYAFSFNNLDTLILKSASISLGTDVFGPWSSASHPRYLEYNCSSVLSSSLLSAVRTVVVGNAVTTIEAQTFKDNHYLTSVTLGSNVTNIGSNAFQNCTNLLSVNLENVTTIYGYAFDGCSALSSVDLGGIVTIGGYAFQGCSNLTSVDFGASVSSIGIHAFKNCTNLTSVRLGDSLLSIGSEAFRGCSSLSNINIGNSLSSIGVAAFWDCGNLHSVILHATTPPTIGLRSYDDGRREVPFEVGCVISIPCSSFNSYQALWTDNSVIYNLQIYNPSTISYQSWITTLPVMVQEANLDMELQVQSSNLTKGYARVKINGSWRNSSETPYPVGCTNQDVIIGAFPYTGYHFDHWSNGVVNNPDTIHLTGDSLLIAYFLPNQYNVVVQSNDESMGTVSGGGSFNYFDTIVIVATAIGDNHFVRWSDGNTSNPRQYIVVNDVSLVAYFEPNVADTCIVTEYPYHEGFENGIDCWTIVDKNNDGFTWNLITELNSGSSVVYSHGGNNMMSSFSWSNNTAYHVDEYLISPAFALPQEQSNLSMWFRVNGGYPVEKLAIEVSTTTNDVNEFSTTLLDITPTAANGAWTHKTINLSSYRGQTIYIAFHHHDSYDQNYIVIDDVSITQGGTQDIDEIVNDDILIYSKGGHIIVEGANDAPISIFDIMGRPMYDKILPNGVYMVVVGSYPARKVVVIR